MSEQITRSIELVRRAQDGDRTALNRLIQRYQERVLKLVRLRLGAKLRQRVESEDIAQETFITAVRLLDNFEMRDEASLIHWLARIAERQITAAADFHSAEKRDLDRAAPFVAEAGAAKVNLEPTADADRPDAELVRGEERRVVEDCLARLPEEYREVILLRDYTGLAWEFIAEQIGSPTAGAARMKHGRALIELGKLVRDAGLQS